MSAPSILDDMIEDVVWLNNLVVRSSSLDGILADSCAQLTILTGFEDFPVSLPGSCTLVRYKTRCYLVCTRHQLKGIAESDYDKVCLAVSAFNGGTNFVTSAGAVWTDPKLYDTEYHEICAFDFTEQCAAYPELGRRFISITEQHPDFQLGSVLWATAYGFPASRVNYDFENRNIDVGRLRISCRFGLKETDSAVHNLSITDNMNMSPDGMSGGPTFFALATGSVTRVHLAGIAVTGGMSNLRIIKAGAVLKMLMTAINQ